MRFVLEVDHEPSALHPARAALDDWCASEDADADSAVIIANELLANAIRHGSGPILLRASATAQWLSVNVQQQGKVQLAVPTHDSSSPLQVSGRGLQMVDAVAESWGWSITATATLVWARLSRTPAS